MCIHLCSLTVSYTHLYEGEAVVEGITGVRVQTPEEIRKVQQQGKIPVLVDPHAAIRTVYQMCIRDRMRIP